MLFTTENELEAFGEALGQGVLSGDEPATVFALVGALGSGKTTFTRGFARGLGVSAKVTSPTFVIAKRYRAKDALTLWHVDAYRLTGDADLETIDFISMLKDVYAVTVIEWAERVGDAMPKDAVWLTFTHDKDGRNVERKAA